MFFGNEDIFVSGLRQIGLKGTWFEWFGHDVVLHILQKWFVGGGVSGSLEVLWRFVRPPLVRRHSSYRGQSFLRYIFGMTSVFYWCLLDVFLVCSWFSGEAAVWLGCCEDSLFGGIALTDEGQRAVDVLIGRVGTFKKHVLRFRQSPPQPAAGGKGLLPLCWLICSLCYCFWNCQRYFATVLCIQYIGIEQEFIDSGHNNAKIVATQLHAFSNNLLSSKSIIRIWSFLMPPSKRCFLKSII